MPSDINPIRSLYDDITLIIETCIVKFNKYAIVEENLDVRKYVDRYFDALLKYDTFRRYKDYSIEEYRIAGVDELPLIRKYASDPSSVPLEIQNRLLDNRRESIIKGFDEPNDYYRLLNGLPYKNDTDIFYVDEEISMKYGIPLDIPLHKIEDNMGEYYISILEALGYIDKLIEENPDKEYLHHLGSKRISIYRARTAKNFELLYISNSISKSVKDKFESIYAQCREYVSSVIYNHYVSEEIDNYDEFIGLVIMLMALQQLCVRSIENSMYREYFDEYTIQLLFKSYNFPFIERLNPDIQKALAHNMNLLIQSKATNQVLYNVANILGFRNVRIYEHMLVKEHKFDEYGFPIFKTKSIVDSDTGDIKTVYDLESMYNVYFQKVDINEIDRFSAFDDDSLKEDYMERVEGDPYWWLDDETYHEVWEEEYNYAETKYLSISISYRTMEMMFENVFLMRMLLDNENNINDILLEIPKILPDTKIRLIDGIISLICMLCKKHNMRGEIITKPSGILHVLDEMDSIRNYSENKQIDCLSFNFPFFEAENYTEDSDIFLSYFTDSQKDQFLEYIKLLDIKSYQTGSRKKDALNGMYQNIKYLYRFIADRMEHATNINEYMALRRFYRTVFYSKELTDEFNIRYKNGEYDTFFDVLAYYNKALYDFINNMDVDMTSYYASHIIDKIEEFIPNLHYLYSGYDLNSPVEEALIKMIRYLKSYTTDFVGLDIIHVFDDTTHNMVKFVDHLSISQECLVVEKYNELDISDNLIDINIRLNIDTDAILFDSLITYATGSNRHEYLEFLDVLQDLEWTIKQDDSFAIEDTLSSSIEYNINSNLNIRESITWYITE